MKNFWIVVAALLLPFVLLQLAWTGLLLGFLGKLIAVLTISGLIIIPIFFRKKNKLILLFPVVTICLVALWFAEQNQLINFPRDL